MAAQFDSSRTAALTVTPVTALPPPACYRLSWHDQKYHNKVGRELSAFDLLGKTSLYNVGHHGSHNATQRGARGAGDHFPHQIEKSGALDSEAIPLVSRIPAT